MAIQKTIDFDRAGKLNLLGRMKIPKPPKNWLTSPGMMKAALKAVDDMIGNKDGFRVKIATVADRMQISEVSAKRALRALRKLGLIEVMRTGRSSWYTIVWEMARSLDPQATKKNSPPPAKKKETAAEPTGKERMTHQRDHSDPSDRSQRPIREITVTHQIDHSDPSTLPTSLTENFTAASYSDQPAQQGWTAAAEVLEQTGYDRVGPAIEECQQLGMPAEELIEICQTFNANRSKFRQAGAIIDRIRTGNWPAAGVQPIAEIKAAKQKAEAERTQGQHESSRRQAEQRAYRQRLEKLEFDYGLTLDHLPADEIETLAGSLFKTRFAMACFRAGNGFGRMEMLTALESSRQTEKGTGVKGTGVKGAGERVDLTL